METLIVILMDQHEMQLVSDILKKLKINAIKLYVEKW